MDQPKRLSVRLSIHLSFCPSLSNRCKRASSPNRSRFSPRPRSIRPTADEWRLVCRRPHPHLHLIDTDSSRGFYPTSCSQNATSLLHPSASPCCFLRAFVPLFHTFISSILSRPTPPCQFSFLNSLHLTSLGDICSFPPLFYASSRSLPPHALFFIPSLFPLTSLHVLYSLFSLFYLFLSTWMPTTSHHFLNWP